MCLKFKNQYNLKSEKTQFNVRSILKSNAYVIYKYVLQNAVYWK